LFGASIGSNFGARKAASRAREEEMQRLGLTQEMLDMAQDAGLSLEQGNEGLKATQDSLETQQRWARMLDADATELYEKAKLAMTEDREEDARQFLLKRTEIQDKLREVLLNCAEEKKRLLKLHENVAALERRAVEVDALMRRNVSAKTIEESSDLGLSLTVEDSLMRKFKDLGID
jgi:phage shock protein A